MTCYETSFNKTYCLNDFNTIFKADDFYLFFYINFSKVL